MPGHPISATQDGVCLQLHVQPRASRSRVVGMHGEAIKVQIAAPPVDNQANEAVIALIAALLEVPRRHVRVSAGSSGRRKLVNVTGVDVATATTLLLGAS
ncbi:MAG: DUF167 domain-containing protein [Pseudomonadota bacterium]